MKIAFFSKKKQAKFQDLLTKIGSTVVALEEAIAALPDGEEKTKLLRLVIVHHGWLTKGDVLAAGNLGTARTGGSDKPE
jgi:hypothetical protein